jgi:hypothetical protein
MARCPREPNFDPRTEKLVESKSIVVISATSTFSGSKRSHSASSRIANLGSHIIEALDSVPLQMMRRFVVCTHHGELILTDYLFIGLRHALIVSWMLTARVSVGSRLPGQQKNTMATAFSQILSWMSSPRSTSSHSFPLANGPVALPLKTNVKSEFGIQC